MFDVVFGQVSGQGQALRDDRKARLERATRCRVDGCLRIDSFDPFSAGSHTD